MVVGGVTWKEWTSSKQKN